MLIDTGSEASLIQEELVYKLEIPSSDIHKIPKTSLINARGKKICEVKEVAIIPLTIQGIEMTMQLIIVPDMESEVIIGNDELDRNQIIIDYKNKEIQVKEVIIKMNDRELYEENNEVISNKKNVHTIQHKIIDNISRYADIQCDMECKEDVINILKEHSGLINKERRIASKYEHKIKMKNLKEFRTRNYPIPYKYRKQVKDELIEMERNGIIEKANTPYINPIIVVMKNSGEIRICLDARNINKVTIPQYEAPLNIDVIFGNITHAKFFTKIDLKHSFWLIPLAEECRNYTGFIVDGVVYRFRVVPFGLQSACSGLVRALHKLLDKYEDFVLHYVDDILIYSKDPESHLNHIKIVIEELDNAGLKINIDKCEFYKEEIIYLGFKLTQDGIMMNPERIQVIQDYKRPTNLKTLRGFIGMINYFKRLIPDISGKIFPLLDLLKKGKKWMWNNEKEEAFRNIKAAFCEELKIYQPDYSKPFILHTDASENKLAGVLLQEKEGKEVPICFVSRITKPYERKYSVSEMELASIVFCVSKLRFYLLGNRFIVKTDHIALTRLMECRYMHNRLHRWMLLMQEYDFVIEFVPGKENIVADALTRDENELHERKKLRINVNVMKNTSGLFSENAIVEDQKKLSEDEYKRAYKKNGVYVKDINGEELYVITKEMAIEIVWRLHVENGHIGARKVWMVFRENYYCANDYKMVKSTIVKCELCQLAKSKNHVNQGWVKSIIAKECMDIVAIDFISELMTSWNRNKHILVVVDIFSRYVKLYPCEKTNKQTVMKIIQKYIMDVGKPKSIILDNATYFKNETFNKFCNRRNIQLKFTSIRHPNSNIAERYIQEVIKYLRIFVHDEHRRWDMCLEEIEHFLNNIQNTTTEQAPIYLISGKMPIRPWIKENKQKYEDVLDIVNKRRKRNAEKYKKRIERKSWKHIKFKQGDWVILRALRVSNRHENRCAKLQLPFEGPYVVMTEKPLNSYMIKDPYTDKIRGVFHINDLYKFKND